MTRTTLYTALTVIITGLFFCTLIPAQAFGGAGPGYGPGCREPGIFRCIGSLDLTQQQRDDIDDLQAETRARILPLREELQRLEIPEALFAQTIDDAAISALLERKKNIHADILEIRHAAMLSAVKLLTPAQRSTMLERKKSRPIYGGRGRRGQGRVEPENRADCPWWE